MMNEPLMQELKAITDYLDWLDKDWRAKIRAGASGTMTPVETHDHSDEIEGWITPNTSYGANIREWPSTADSNPPLYRLKHGDALAIDGKADDAEGKINAATDKPFVWYMVSDGDDNFVREDVVIFSHDKPQPITLAPLSRWPAPSPIERLYTITNRHDTNGHKGIDLATGDRAPNVYGLDKGYIVKASPCPKCDSIGTPGVRAISNNYGYGHFVIASFAIDPENPNTTYLHCLYAHLSMIFVSTGQTLFDRQAIGAVGTTGDSTGKHLHLECRVGKARDTRWAEMQSHEINPLLFFTL